MRLLKSLPCCAFQIKTDSYLTCLVRVEWPPYTTAGRLLYFPFGWARRVDIREMYHKFNIKKRNVFGKN